MKILQIAELNKGYAMTHHGLLKYKPNTKWRQLHSNYQTEEKWIKVYFKISVR